MNSSVSGKAWNPYLAGALLGVLAIASVWATTLITDGSPKYLGASTTFVRAAGMIEEQAAPDHVANNAYFQSKKVKSDWQFILVSCIFFGALVASFTDRSFKLESVPPMWAERFGRSVPLRAIGGFVGGVVAIFGARMAGGCPSGHGLSGIMQLSVSGFIAMAGFFIGGIVMARIVYGGLKK